MGNPFIDGFRASREDKRLDDANERAEGRVLQLQQQVDIMQSQNDRQQKVADDLDTNETLFDLETTGNWDGFAHVANRIPGLTNGRLEINPISPDAMFEASEVPTPSLDERNGVTMADDGSIYIAGKKLSPDFLQRTSKLIDYGSFNSSTMTVDEEDGATTVQHPLIKRLSSLRRVSDMVINPDGTERGMQTYASPASTIMGIGPISGYQDFRSKKLASERGKDGKAFKPNELIQLADMNRVINEGKVDLEDAINPQTGQPYGKNARAVYEILATSKNMDKKYARNRLGDFGGDTKSPSMVEKVTTATKKDVPLLGTPEYKRYTAQLIQDENTSGNKYNDTELKIRPATAGLGSLVSTIKTVADSKWSSDLFKPNTVTTTEPLLDENGVHVYKEENILEAGVPVIDAITGVFATKSVPQYRKVSQAKAASEGINSKYKVEGKLVPENSGAAFKQMSLNSLLSSNMRKLLNTLSGQSVSDTERVDFFDSMLGGDASRIDKATILASLSGVKEATETGIQQSINQLSDYINPGTKADLTLKLQEALATKGDQPTLVEGASDKTARINTEAKAKVEKEVEDAQEAQQLIDDEEEFNTSSLFDIDPNYLQKYGSEAIADASGGLGSLTKEEIFAPMTNKVAEKRADDLYDRMAEANKNFADEITPENVIEFVTDLVSSNANEDAVDEMFEKKAFSKFDIHAYKVENKIEGDLNKNEKLDLLLTEGFKNGNMKKLATKAGVSTSELMRYIVTHPEDGGKTTPKKVREYTDGIRNSDATDKVRKRGVVRDSILFAEMLATPYMAKELLKVGGKNLRGKSVGKQLKDAEDVAKESTTGNIGSEGVGLSPSEAQAKVTALRNKKNSMGRFEKLFDWILH